jgi:soluble lytic murein transglycosylase
MTIRYALMLLLFVTALVVPSRLALTAAPGADGGADQRRASGFTAGERDAAERSRHARASRILGEYLAVADRPAPEAGILVSGSVSDRGDWSTLTRLLRSGQWLDAAGSPGGWSLFGPARGLPGEVLARDVLGRALVAGEGDSREQSARTLRRGLLLTAGGQTAAAVAVFDQAANEFPWLADWAHLYAAESIAATGDTAEVRRRLAQAGRELTAARGWRFQVRAARVAGDLPQARRLALDAVRSAGDASTRAAAWVLLADLRLEAGDTSRAREAYRSAIEAAPGGIAAIDAARGLSRVRPAPEEWRMIGSIYLRHGNQARAIAAFESYLTSGAGTAGERAHARLQIGQATFDAGRYSEAERRMLQLGGEPVPARVAAQALYLVGRAQLRQGRGAEAMRTFALVGERFPSQAGAARALFLLADLQHDNLELDSARANYRRAASAWPALNEAGLALMRLGGLEYLAGDYAGAAEVFEEYRRLHPTGQRTSKATYWAARSYAALGRDDDARALYRSLRTTDPLSYYGIRAGEMLGERALAIPMEPSPPRRERTDSLVRAGLRRVDVLAELDRRTDLVHEVERLRAHFAREDGGDYALAEGLAERGYTLMAISMGWDMFRRQGAWDKRLLRVIYPFPFQALVAYQAQDQGVDPYLVAAVIRRESAFNPTVTSSAGAIGLMQIMPHTGRGLASEVGLRGYNPGLLQQPELNVHLGVRYLANLLQQFNAELPLVLSAYNAGPGRAVRWRRMPERSDAELFMERIPFTETRDYVRHVKIHLALYRELYPGLDGPARAAAD